MSTDYIVGLHDFWVPVVWAPPFRYSSRRSGIN